MYTLIATVSKPGNYTCEAVTSNLKIHSNVAQVSIGMEVWGMKDSASIGLEHTFS